MRAFSGLLASTAAALLAQAACAQNDVRQAFITGIVDRLNQDDDIEIRIRTCNSYSDNAYACAVGIGVGVVDIIYDTSAGTSLNYFGTHGVSNQDEIAKLGTSILLMVHFSYYANDLYVAENNNTEFGKFNDEIISAYGEIVDGNLPDGTYSFEYRSTTVSLSRDGNEVSILSIVPLSSSGSTG